MASAEPKGVFIEAELNPRELLWMSVKWLESVALPLQGMDHSLPDGPMSDNQETAILLWMRCYHLLNAAKEKIHIYPEVASILARVILENADRMLYLTLRAKEQESFDASVLFDKGDKKGTTWEAMIQYIAQHGPERYQNLGVDLRKWLNIHVHSGDLSMYQARGDNGQLAVVLGVPADIKYMLAAILHALVAGISVVQIEPYLHGFVADSHIGLAEIYADQWCAPAILLTNTIGEYLVKVGHVTSEGAS